MRIKVKLINGEWMASSNFNGSSIITNLDDFYKWNIRGEGECRENKDLMQLTYDATGMNFKNSVTLYRMFKDCVDENF